MGERARAAGQGALCRGTGKSWDVGRLVETFWALAAQLYVVPRHRGFVIYIALWPIMLGITTFVGLSEGRRQRLCEA